MNGKRTDIQIIRDMLKMGTATETIDPSRDYILQPTPAGQALMRLIDTLESIDTKKQERECPPTREQSPVVLSPNMAVTMMLMRDRLFQGYVLEQAEVARLEALLKYDGDDEELIKEYKQREQKLNLLHELYSVLTHLVDHQID